MKVYVMLATGFEITEAMLPIDILKRAGIEAITVSVENLDVVAASNGTRVLPDLKMSDANLSDGEMIFLPGGMPGSKNLDENPAVINAVSAYNEAGKWLVAVCAAPLVFGHMGLLNGQKATCYPGFEDELHGADHQQQTVVRSGKIITGCGPGACFALGREMVAALVSEEAADKILSQMMFNVYA
ncbi:MAG: DJ-1/PfpI family protein [Bacteroidales bacterium]|nr:DJ-1/PfpI family protein [Bacteroidales bacterium]